MPRPYYEHHERMKEIPIRHGNAGPFLQAVYELTELPEQIAKHTERVFITIPFSKRDVPMIEEGLGEVFKWVEANGRKSGGYTVVDVNEDGAMHINVCMGCVHRMVTELTKDHPENASDEDIANAVLSVAFRSDPPDCQD